MDGSQKYVEQKKLDTKSTHCMIHSFIWNSVTEKLIYEDGSLNNV